MIEFKVFYNHKLLKRSVITKNEISIGRSDKNDIVLQDKHVSRLHIIIQRKDEQFWVEDKSTNGVLLDGKALIQSSILPRRCRIGIFPFDLECICHQEDKTFPISREEVLPTSEPDRHIELETASGIAITYHYGWLVGESRSMRRVYRLIEDVADSPATVLVRGEHGTGKELVAKAIHHASSRKDGRLITVNCTAIPFELIESEVFGYEKGAFTGAVSSNKGKIEAAEGGTLFLDEIGELSLLAQAKFLRFLQDRSFTRLGSGHETKADVRVVAATNKDLENAVKEENFRADLYYRIKVVQISLPPLRERPEDIPLLVRHFIQKFRDELGLSTNPIMTSETMNWFQSSRWPGNVRQLENTLYSGLIKAHPPYVLNEALFVGDIQTLSGSEEETEPPLDAISKNLLLKILNDNHGDTSKTAEVLKVSRGTIYYRLKKYGIDPRNISES